MSVPPISSTLAHRAAPNSDYAELKAFVIAATGLSYYVDKDEVLADHIARRMTELSLDGYRQYHELLNTPGGERELDVLAVELTIGETYFFRHPEQLDALEAIAIPRILERNRDVRHLRIWCAGCSTGPEPYSLAIFLKSRFGDALDDWRVEIIGTDINRHFLARAEEARYQRWALRSVPEEVLGQAFRCERGGWRVLDVYREWVSFRYHNLACHPFPSLLHDLRAFDLILCRNVLIYFSREHSESIVRQFSETLVPAGWLALGPSDLNLRNLDLFDHDSETSVWLYRKPEPGVCAAGGRAARASPVAVVSSPAATPLSAPKSDRRARARLRAAPVVRKTSPPDAPTERLALARELADRGQEAEAERVCRTMLESEPMIAPAHLLFALLLESRGSDDEAEEAFRRAIYLDPSLAVAHYRLAANLRRRKLPGASRCFRNALRCLRDLADEQQLEKDAGITAADLRRMTEIDLAKVRSA